MRDPSEIRVDISRMEDYLDLRRKMRDWHGVMDAAADLRELEVELRIVTLEQLTRPKPTIPALTNDAAAELLDIPAFLRAKP